MIQNEQKFAKEGLTFDDVLSDSAESAANVAEAIDSLDSALDLLKQLKGDNKKLVGIISHVTKLGEKIAAKIDVTSKDGMGAILGAGVKSLADVQAIWASEHPEEAEAIEKARLKAEKEAEKERRKAEKERRKAERMKG